MNGWSAMVGAAGVVLLIALLGVAGVAYEARHLITAASFTSSGTQASFYDFYRPDRNPWAGVAVAREPADGTTIDPRQLAGCPPAPKDKPKL